MISSVSEGRSTINWLTTNPSDVPFAFPDARTLTMISKIVSDTDGDSNEHKVVSNQLSGPYISPSTIRERLRPSTSSVDFSRPISTFSTFFEFPRHSSTFQFARFPRFLLSLSSTLRALLRSCPSLLVLILNTSRPHSVIYAFNS
jgi:hypothetical protein